MTGHATSSSLQPGARAHPFWNGPRIAGEEYEIRVEHGLEGWIAARISGELPIELFLSTLHVLGIESDGSDEDAILVDLRALHTVYTARDLVRVGQEIAASLVHMRRVALLVLPHRVTRISQRAARHSGLDMRVFDSADDALRWLRLTRVPDHPGGWMKNHKLEILFVCARNSARSIMAEAILRHYGAHRFEAYSAGANPAKAPHPLALEVLREAGIATDGLHSKGWELFAGPAAPELDVIVTMSGTVAAMTPPDWPGRPITVTWRFPDPLEAEGDEGERREVFRSVMFDIHRRIELMLSLPADRLERLRLEEELAGLAS